MKKDEIMDFLLEGEISEVEEIPYKEDVLLLRAYYDFDEDEIKAAKAYAKDEYEGEIEDDQWYDEFFLPYLSDVAIDNLGDIMEDLMEDFEVEGQYVSYDLSKENWQYNEFILAISPKGKAMDIEDALNELNL
ncbi:hypothetical protein KQI89_13735 [Clostridium sp. MSJ-4]|uniref:DUF2004 domain-containing protein n=1 Tax=Clostridium simiarum TaxID=2841506 RepID=A0ABS6F4Q7_9CLOT|nr:MULTISPECIES: hypothetical protein [Clostridium]MBU5592809.1 hypothetical protein [Clostridium simiarum]